MSQTSAFGASAADQPLASLAIERREPGARDITIEILFCGVCHSDLHTARGEWGQKEWPIVPGHEIVGRITEVGAEVDGFAVGDLAGVGCMVDSCRTCASCTEGLEQYCENGPPTFTYGGVEKETGRMTQGGYSKAIVVDQDFVLHISEGVEPSSTAPLLCAGITTYSPLRHWNVGADSKVGVVGLGGLGHMAVKIAKAMGAEVTLFTTSPGKADDGRALGASEIVISTDAKAMGAVRGTLDLVIDTVAAAHDRHRRDPGDARLLRRARRHRRCRDDLDGPDRRRLRADAGVRRQVPVRDRYGVDALGHVGRRGCDPGARVIGSGRGGAAR
jgi:uncharacterized zinc-type alcohol dehydrogenase-like protein